MAYLDDMRENVWMPIGKAAEATGIDRKTLRRWIKKGAINRTVQGAPLWRTDSRGQRTRGGVASESGLVNIQDVWIKIAAQRRGRPCKSNQSEDGGYKSAPPPPAHHERIRREWNRGGPICNDALKCRPPLWFKNKAHRYRRGPSIITIQAICTYFAIWYRNMQTAGTFDNITPERARGILEMLRPMTELADWIRAQVAQPTNSPPPGRDLDPLTDK